MTANQIEPWLRETLADVPAVQRAVLHALELAAEDIDKWCGGLSDDELNARPADIAPVAFHLRHIARSLDRLLTYAESHQLTDEQIDDMKAEPAPNAKREVVMAELSAALTKSAARLRAIDAARLEDPRTVGKRQLPTTLGGLLVHVADHTQRHVGQTITTAKIVLAMSTKSRKNR